MDKDRGTSMNMNNKMLNDISCSLLTIIIDRGKGSKILEITQEMGAKDASCFIGKGTIRNKFLQMIGMDDVDREIILVVVASDRETEFLRQLNRKFDFERKNHGIAFMIPLAGILCGKEGGGVRWNERCLSAACQWDYTAMLLVVDKDKEEQAIQICHDGGYYGGTVIKARGSASQLNIVLDMVVEPEKEVVLMLMGSAQADQLASLLNEQLQLDKPNTGILIKMGVSRAIGLFENNE